MNAEIFRVFVKRFDLNTAFFVVDHARRTIQSCWHVVIRHSNRFLGRTYLAAGHTQTFKGLGAGHFVNKVTIDVQQACAISVLRHHMGIPDFVIDCFWGGHFNPLPPELAILNGIRSGPASEAGKHSGHSTKKPPRQPRTIIHVEYVFHSAMHTQSDRVYQDVELGSNILCRRNKSC